MKANLTTICSTETQEEIRIFLGSFLAPISITDSEKNQIILAVDEAVANAIIHGNEQDNSRSIQIDISISKKSFTVEISDIGLFDEITKQDKKDKELKAIIKEKQKGGLGLKLIYSIMDVVVFYTKDGKSYCRLVKMLK
ncbi:MAG: ATP-binding protein [Chitinophagales bacterium]|nr:ATP-binding protein [Chitinophagales bacterium]